MAIKNLLLSMVSLALISCDIPVSSNDNWQDVIKAADSECPDITGTYSIMDKPGYLMLGSHYEDPKRRWEVMSIAGNPQQELHITLYEANTGVRYNAPIKRTRNKDYQCKDGMLETAWPYMDAPINRSDESIPDDDLVEKSLSFAKNKNGDLVLRTNTHTWKGISVWCGDGCKYLPIPFTSRTHYQWSRWPSSDIPKEIAANASLQPADIDASAPANETPEGRATRLLRNTIPQDVKLSMLTRKGDNWKASLRGNSNVLIAAEEALQSSSTIQVMDTKIDSTSGTLSIEFRLAPTKEEREAKQAKEREALHQALQHDAEDKALVKKLLPSFPNDMVLSLSHLDENGFLVEVRHTDEEAFYQLIVKAIASGEFLKADIMAHKYVDPYGRKVVDILLIPKPNEQTSN